MTEQEPPDWFAELSSAGSTGYGASEPPATPRDEATRRRRRRTRRIVGLIAVVVVLALVGTYADLTLNAPIGAAAVSATSPNVDPPAAAKIVMPSSGEAAMSISGGDQYLGAKADTLFASSGGNGRLPMASISKLITALVVLDARPLGASGRGATISWTPADIKLYDKYYLLNATIAPMKAGSTMTEHDAIETMLVVSACNYAEAVADWAFGSQANFLYQARRWLTAHGLTHTTMVEATGIDALNTSTPTDLLKLGTIAMANPAIASIVKMTSLVVPTIAGMSNTNDLLGTDGVDGIKTGTLHGSDLLFHAVITPGTDKPLSITGIVLAGPDRGTVDADVKAMIDSVASGFHEVQLGTAGDAVGTYSTAWGSAATMVLGKGAETLTWSNTPITSSITTTTLKTGAKGETVGSVTWKTSTATITVPVVLAGKIQGPSAWWRLTHPSQLLGKK